MIKVLFSSLVFIQAHRSEHCRNALLLLEGLVLLQLLDLNLAILLQDARRAIGLRALLQRVVGDGEQLVALLLGVAQLEAVKVVQTGAL